ncbi:MAG: VTT domain-containing protein [Chloroflexales bacterium]|nr:VTT domain-containing protein [Chloroflexales bacterium]
MPQRRNAIIGMIVLMIAINVGCYFLPIDYTFLGNYAIAGVFGVTAIATATIIVPVPYIPVVMHIAQQYHDLYDLVLVALAAGFGSVVGEISGYVVGRSGRQAFESTCFSRWVAAQMTHPVRAFVALFALAAPPNPLFDVAGMAAGAFGVPFWVFASAVFCGRFVRMLGIVIISAWYGSASVIC